MIETERLILRPHALSDFAASYAMWSDSEVTRFIGGKPASREDAWNRLLRTAGHWALLGYGLFAIFEKASGCFVGETGLADFHRGLGDRFDPFPEAAWVLAGSAQGKGYAAEAAIAAHDWFARQQPLGRSVCIINPANAGSVRLAEKLGYAPFGETTYHDAPITMFARTPAPV